MAITAKCVEKVIPRRKKQSLEEHLTYLPYFVNIDDGQANGHYNSKDSIMIF